MLTACGRAPPFGDLAKCATAAGADAGGAGIQLANSFARGWRALPFGSVLGQNWEVAKRCWPIVPPLL